MSSYSLIGTFGVLGPYEGGKPDATFFFTDEDFFKVATGKMNPQIAFMRYNIYCLFLFVCVCVCASFCLIHFFLP